MTTRLPVDLSHFCVLALTPARRRQNLPLGNYRPATLLHAHCSPVLFARVCELRAGRSRAPFAPVRSSIPPTVEVEDIFDATPVLRVKGSHHFLRHEDGRSTLCRRRTNRANNAARSRSPNAFVSFPPEQKLAGATQQPAISRNLYRSQVSPRPHPTENKNKPTHVRPRRSTVRATVIAENVTSCIRAFDILRAYASPGTSRHRPGPGRHHRRHRRRRGPAPLHHSSMAQHQPGICGSYPPDPQRHPARHAQQTEGTGGRPRDAALYPDRRSNIPSQARPRGTRLSGAPPVHRIGAESAAPPGRLRPPLPESWQFSRRSRPTKK